jgi:hypothetical protein
MPWGDAFVFTSGLCVGLLFHYWKCYTGTFAQKSAEIDAIDKKIDQVLDQQKKTTELTEGIKADFSDKSSSRQRLREMRREVAFKMVNALTDLDAVAADALEEADLYAASGNTTMGDDYRQKHDELSERFRLNLKSLVQLWGQVGLVFDDPASDLARKVNNAAIEILRTTNRFQYERKKADELFEIFRQRCRQMRKEIREQLLA